MKKRKPYLKRKWWGETYAGDDFPILFRIIIYVGVFVSDPLTKRITTDLKFRTHTPLDPIEKTVFFLFFRKSDPEES